MSIKFDVVKRPVEATNVGVVLTKLNKLRGSEALRVKGRKPELMRLASTLRTAGYRLKTNVHYKASRGYFTFWIDAKEGRGVRSDKGHGRIPPLDRKDQITAVMKSARSPLRPSAIVKMTGIPLSTIYMIMKKYIHVFIQHPNTHWALR